MPSRLLSSSRRNGTSRRNACRGYFMISLFLFLLWRARGGRKGFTNEDFPSLDRHLRLGLPRAQPSIEIFSAPKPFSGSDDDASIAAIKSWKKLAPTPRITLVGRGSSYEKVAAQLGVSWTDAVDTTFLGVPQFHSIVALANGSTADITVIINGDILLFQDFIHSLFKVYSTFEHFLAVGARYDVRELPNDFLASDSSRSSRVRDYVRENGVLHTQGGMDLWAWNTNGPRLYDRAMPTFIFGRGKYDNWFTHETISAGRYQVVDITETCISVHVSHEYKLGNQQMHATDPDESESRFDEDIARTFPASGSTSHDLSSSGMNRTSSDEQDVDLIEVERDPTTSAVTLPSYHRRLTSFWSFGKLSKFEVFTNIYLSLRTGTYINGMGTTRHTPWKLAACHEPSGMCLVKRHRPGLCYCEYSTFVRRSQVDPKLTKKGLPKPRCVEQSIESKDVYSLPVSLREGTNEPKHFGLPLTITDAISSVVINNTIIVSALNYGYRSIMMNWVCNMRRLGITNFVIAALDPELYLYAYTNGIATYHEDTLHTSIEGEKLKTEGVYGTEHFKRLTKMKTQVVVRILRLGYNVIWSDTDIIFFKNPIQYLWEQNADLAIQSNAPDKEDANGKQRINSGFYLVRSTDAMIEAFEEIVQHALHSRKSEQPSFYDVLCGVDMEHTVRDDMCLYNGLRIKLLDRRLFPNGGTLNIWDTRAGWIQKKFPQLFILHNNWVKGISGKEERLQRHGMIMFNGEEQVCRYEPMPLK